MKPVDTVETIVEAEPGVYSILRDGVSYEARVSGRAITVNGHRFTPAAAAGKAAGGASGRASILAPMPGKVVRVMVAAGDEVTAGQGIAVVEAMKMQNELKAPRAGRVTMVHVRENDSVNAGALLATVD